MVTTLQEFEYPFIFTNSLEMEEFWKHKNIIIPFLRTNLLENLSDSVKSNIETIVETGKKCVVAIKFGQT